MSGDASNGAEINITSETCTSLSIDTYDGAVELSIKRRPAIAGFFALAQREVSLKHLVFSHRFNNEAGEGDEL